MAWSSIEQNWKQFSRNIKQKWVKLSTRLRRVSLPVKSQSIGAWQRTQKRSIRCRGIAVGGSLPRPRS